MNFLLYGDYGFQNIFAICRRDVQNSIQIQIQIHHQIHSVILEKKVMKHDFH